MAGIDNMIDIHSHILPGVDDGADCTETSCKMLQIAADNGITHIILTPHNKPSHHNVSSAHMAEYMERLQRAAQKRQVVMKLYAGNELYYRDGIVEELEAGEAMTLAGSRYVLVEFSPMAEYDYIRNGIYTLQSHGYRTILAHAERYRTVCQGTDQVEDLINMGCYIQMNAGSIMGRYGFAAKQFTRKLLKNNLVQFIATDAHDTDKRSPRIADCVGYVEKKLGVECAKKLFYDNPMCILQDEYLS